MSRRNLKVVETPKLAKLPPSFNPQRVRELLSIIRHTLWSTIDDYEFRLAKAEGSFNRTISPVGQKEIADYMEHLAKRYREAQELALEELQQMLGIDSGSGHDGVGTILNAIENGSWLAESGSVETAGEQP